ncbi:hypothetical protein [Mesorhizobium sp.]|uniref:hypothetical protein n=1 Tax=Mesorhizobium sp. TaxID=1871066 RepID=UPI0025E51832|nr:hypothetical protein [Mesorhizobium sp.]
MTGLKSSGPARPRERRVAARLLGGNGLALGTLLAALLAADASTLVRIADLPIGAGVANGLGNTGNFNGLGNTGHFNGNGNAGNFNGNGNSGNFNGNGNAGSYTAISMAAASTATPIAATATATATRPTATVREQPAIRTSAGS